MRRVKQIGAIILDEYGPLYVQEYNMPENVQGATRISAAGTHIVHEALIYTPHITLDSQGDSWVGQTNRDALEAMWDTLGETFTITYEDDSTDTVRMERSKKMALSPLYDCAEIYAVTIPLAKVQ